MNKLKILELFGGIGACSKALERLGIDYEIADYVEIDKYAVKSFNAIHNTNFEPQDICNWDKDIEVDLIMHGSPCQDFSLAGKQAGGDENSGTRSSLMYETIRIVERLKPKYVIWENVKNVISKKHKHNFDNYIERMNQLGYKSTYQVLNAKDYGIPQNRERVFTISIRNDINKEFIFPPKQELKLKLKDMLEDEVDEKYYLSDKMINYVCARMPLGNHHITTGIHMENRNSENVAGTICTEPGNKPSDNYIIDNDNIIYSKEIGYLVDSRNMKEKLCDKLIEENKVKEYDVIRHSYSNSRIKEWEKRNVETNNEVPTLDTRCDCLGVAVKNNTKQGYLKPQVLGGYGKIGSTNQYHLQNRIYDNQIGVTITTTCNPNYIDNNLRIRKLTPKECWRLMGFDDEDFNKASQINSNAQLYKQAGNSIVVNVLMAIFKELI